jgi:hypothetical protein
MGYNARPELILISSVLPVLDPTMFLWWFAQSCCARHKKIKQNSVESRQCSKSCCHMNMNYNLYTYKSP